jgi:hypothetical protein
MDLGEVLLEWEVRFSDQINPSWKGIGNATNEGKKSILKSIGLTLIVIVISLVLIPLFFRENIIERLKLFAIVLIPLAAFGFLYMKVAKGMKSVIKIGTNGIQIGVIKTPWSDFECYELNPDKTITLYYKPNKAAGKPSAIIKAGNYLDQADYIFSQYLTKRR